MKLILLLLSISVFTIAGITQNLHFQGEVYSSENSQKEIDQLLQSLDASEIVWNTGTIKSTDFPAKLRNSKGYWQVYYGYEQCLIGAKKNSLKRLNFNLPGPTMEYLGFTLVEKKDKYAFFSFSSFNTTKFEWDEIAFENMDYYDNALFEMDSLEKIRMNNEEYGFEIELEPIEWNKLKISARKENLWYRIELREDAGGLYIYQHGLGEKEREVLLDPTELNVEDLKLLDATKRENKLDLLLTEGEYLTYSYGRFEKTHQWGVFGGEDANELIAPIYDSVSYHENAHCFELWLKGKVYVYNMEYKDLLPEDSFNDFQVIFLDYMYGFAVKNQKGWHLYDAQTGDRMVKGTAPNTDALVDLWLNRFDEE